MSVWICSPKYWKYTPVSLGTHFLKNVFEKNIMGLKKLVVSVNGNYLG